MKRRCGECARFVATPTRQAKKRGVCGLGGHITCSGSGAVACRTGFIPKGPETEQKKKEQ